MKAFIYTDPKWFAFRVILFAVVCGALYLILQNRIYRGETVHKNEAYPGEHQAIIDPALWNAVHARLSENAVERGAGIRVKNPSLLTCRLCANWRQSSA